MIQFFNEDIDFKMPNVRRAKLWLKALAAEEGYQLNQLNYIFCSDEYLLQVNKEYLNHDFYTDIITFDNSEFEQEIEGDIFVSIDRIKDNAIQLNKTFDNELCRVLAHGLLHLTGYLDKTDEEEKKMREKEDYYLHKL
jgi:probable rRNA maturation factor